MKHSFPNKLLLRNVSAVLAGICFMASTSNFATASEQTYTLFESGQVRPLALSPAGDKLYAVNTPDNTLEVFSVTEGGVSLEKSIPVGMEPVAVVTRGDNEAWVVNHLSDSVSIVDLSQGKERVVRTLLVGDEPRDIVFAGDNGDRAFITTAHRGQNIPFDPQLTTPGVGRADVWVFDANNLGNNLEGTPLNIITLFTDTPRALAVSQDGKSVYAAGFKTGTQTTTVWVSKVTEEGGPPEPTTNVTGETQPASGLIVKWNGEHWVDEIGRIFDEHVKFSLPDKDVFKIDATANPPVLSSGNNVDFSSVGSVLFNMIVNPVNNKVYVTNIDSHNENRFEGHGFFSGGKTVRGQFVENRISILDGNGGVTHRHLNKHIDYSHCCDPLPNDENSKSLSTPMGMEISQDGKTLYVAGFGSSKIGVYDTKKLEDDTYKPSTKDQVIVTGGGPSGLVLDNSGSRLYVLTRFDNAVSVIDTKTKSEIAHVAMFNPEPASIVAGRPFLYDAAHTSSRGDSSCASCHIFGDMDQLAWDLGDPDITSVPMYGHFRNTAALLNVPTKHEFAAMKGPMTTQSLRGMANHGPMHWRGDRTGVDPILENNFQPDGGQFNEEVAFKAFNVAFVGLIGRDTELTEAEMDAFTQFALQITYPPNPIRNLDNSMTADQQAGFEFFTGAKADTFFGCFECHVLDRNANAEYGVAKPGFFGSDGFYNVTRLSTQPLKVPHLRNMYQKIGMFGFPQIPQHVPDLNGQNEHMGDQIRGFGFHHDGSRGTLFLQQSARGFIFRNPGQNGPNDPGNPNGYPVDRAIADPIRRQTEQFLLAFDSNLFPVVGQQVTLTASNSAVVSDRIDLLVRTADAGQCDLVAKQSGNRGYLYTPMGHKFNPNSASAKALNDNGLRKLANEPNGEITYTCVPPGSGMRIALDRDEDGVLDLDE
ncbi:YncE family protein [Kaarinaea lacus]